MKYIKIVFLTGLLVTIYVVDAMRIIPRVGKGGVPLKIPGGLPKGSVPFPFMPKPNTPVVNQSGSTTIPTQQQKIVCSAALKDIAKPLPQRQDVQPVASLLQPVDWLRLLQTQDVKVPEHNLEGELLPQEEKIQTITDIVQVCKPILNTDFQEEGFFEKKEQNNKNKEPIQKEQEAQEELSVERVEENVQAEPEMVKEELQEDLQQGKDVQRLEEVRLQEELRNQEQLALEQKEQELAEQEALQEQIRQEELVKEQELFAKQEEERVLQEQQKKEQELFEQQEREKEIAQQEAERQEIALRKQEEMRLQEELRKQEQLALEQKEQELLAKQEEERVLQEQQKKEQELFEQQEREKEIAQQEAERQEIALRKQEEMRLQEELRKQEQLALEQKEQELLAKQEEERVLQEQQKKEQELFEQQEREKEIAQQEAEREQKIRLAKQEQAQKELDILKQKETELVQNLEREKEREKEANLALDELKAQELLAQKKREEAQKKEEELIELLKRIEKQDLLAQEELHNSKRLAEVKAQALAEAKTKEDRAREALEKLEFEYQQKQRELERQQKEQELLLKVEQVDSAAQVEPFKQDFQPITEAEPIPEIPQKVQNVTLENYNDELAQARFPKKEITIEKENIVEKEPSEQPKEVRPLEEVESPQELIQQEQIKTESVEFEPSEFVQELVADVKKNQQEPVSEIQLQTPVEERAINQVAIGTQHNIPTVVPIPSLPTIAEQPLLQEKQPVIGGLTSVEKVALPPRAIESFAETLSELKKEEVIKDSKQNISLAQEKESGSFETISKKPPLVPLGQKNLSPSYPGRSAETYPKIPPRQESLGAQKPFNDRSDTYPQEQKTPSSGKQEQYQVQELLEQNGTRGEGRVQTSQKENWRSIIDKYGISSAPQTESFPVVNKPSRPSESLNRPELVTDYSQIPEESSLNKELPRHTSYSGKSNQQQPKAEKPKKIKKEQPSESVWMALLQVFAMLGALGLFFGIIIRIIVKFFRR